MSRCAVPGCSLHDAGLLEVTLGPRREVALRIRLDPVWNPGVEAERMIRISAIDNFEEVAAFFGSLGSPVAPDADLDRIEGFEWLNRRELCLELARAGTVTFIGPKVTAR